MAAVSSESLLAILERSRELGFLGPGPVDAHVVHSLGFAAALKEDPSSSCLDLGAGGGIPGLVLASHWPSSNWVFLDAHERRTAFLREAVHALGLEARVDVHRARAEDAGRDPALRGRFGLIVARSFGRPAVTAECAAPLLGVGGLLVVSEPPAGDRAVRWPTEGVALLGLTPGSSPDSSYALFRLAAACDERFPRRVGIPAKRPLF